MVKSFADRHTQALYATGKSRRFPPDFVKRAGQHAISVNDQWRICFRFVDGDAHDVEITDYH